MALDKIKIKKGLEKERDLLMEELKGIAKMNTKTGEWDAVPEEINYKQSDQNDMADRFEDFESRSSTVDVLKGRLENVLTAIKNINKESFGMCVVCKKPIEALRIKANPAANTCKKHMD